MTKIDNNINQGGANYSPDTKERIIEVSSLLFAKFGYDNASVRDISNEAGVNVAAINYHFKNKLMLYKEVMNSNMLMLEQKIKQISENSSSMKQFTWNIFSHFTQESGIFINSFKLFTNNTLPENSELIPQACSNANYGPPGHQYMLAILNKELPENISSEDRDWAVRVIFGYVAHVSLICCSTIGKLMCDKVEHLNPENKKRSIEMHTEAIINYLKTKAE